MKTKPWFAGGLLAGAAMLAGCGEDAGDGTVQLEFFSNKTENTGTYQALIEEFEEQHPGIEVNLYAPPDAETVLRTRLVKDDMPDLLAIAGSALYGELVSAGMLQDYEGDPVLDNIQESYLGMLEELEGSDTPGIHGVPFAANANTVIYNKEMMEELGGDIPETWDEFIELLEMAEEAEEIPILFTLQEAWTIMPAWNALAGNLQPERFAERKSEGELTFANTHVEVTEKLEELLEYGHSRMHGIGYNDGNREFSQGNGLLYFQGNWAVPEILSLNPDMELGVFALPVTNNPEENKLVSGVDVLLTALEDTDHPEETDAFISFLLEEGPSTQYMEEQAAFSVLQGVVTDDPAMEGIADHFENDQITSFPDHFYLPGMGVENMVQGFTYGEDRHEFLSQLDRTWDQIQLRY
ncbi:MULTISPECIES: ABC transporter substrate-binding protein [Alteribacter]|uniref:Extracellular solute-binding protein n=1 Tax=Alteribacter keqinensis TaxID=2483800 RepID=A0A3M7TNE1_9BACI|nr:MULTISPECIES: extracellular solute-binding protein [Alteribacter]MBM7094823.1 extracellular solute-binding protein [Alteribacter salitolerans]RNA66636.1 extracellular solute-binding protein [Alteribacter keqinensis]